MSDSNLINPDGSVPWDNSFELQRDGPILSGTVGFKSYAKAAQFVEGLEKMYTKNNVIYFKSRATSTFFEIVYEGGNTLRVEPWAAVEEEGDIEDEDPFGEI